MSGIGDLRSLGVGGVEFGGEVVEEGHVGRMVGRFEGRAYHKQRQDFDQEFHECAHRSSVAIDNDHDDDDDDDKTSTRNNDVKSPVTSPTNKQQPNR